MKKYIIALCLLASCGGHDLKVNITNMCEVQLGKKAVERIAGIELNIPAYRSINPMDQQYVCGQKADNEEQIKYMACASIIGAFLGGISGEYLCQQAFHEYLHYASAEKCNQFYDFTQCFPRVYPEAMVEACKNTNQICGTVNDPE